MVKACESRPSRSNANEVAGPFNLELGPPPGVPTITFLKSCKRFTREGIDKTLVRKLIRHA